MKRITLLVTAVACPLVILVLLLSQGALATAFTGKYDRIYLSYV